MSAEPIAHHEDAPDPQRILTELPEDEREFFLEQYREAVSAAREPAGWEGLRRFLRLWRFHADNTHDPEYWKAAEAASRPFDEHDGGMFLEDYIRMRRGE
jgi:hypothetical protein